MADSDHNGSLEEKVAQVGVEPTTRTVEGCCVYQLRHWAKFVRSVREEGIGPSLSVPKTDGLPLADSRETRTTAVAGLEPARGALTERCHTVRRHR